MAVGVFVIVAIIVGIFLSRKAELEIPKAEIII
jgi:hypothetical protein